MSLTPAQRRYLRGLAHPLKPVLLLGGKGVTPSVLAELEHALDDHELIKVKLTGEDREERSSSLTQLLDASGAENVQRIGHVAVLYRRNAEQPRIALPRDAVTVVMSGVLTSMKASSFRTRRRRYPEPAPLCRTGVKADSGFSPAGCPGMAN